MKIAILTQPLEKNYGGIIQAFALQKYLRDLGHDVTTIDRREPDKKAIDKILFTLSRTIKKLMGKRKAPIFFERCHKIIYQHTRAFIKNNIVVSPRLTSTEMLSHYFKDEDFDLVIVGSDQVWRPDYSPNIFNFFCDFVPNKKTKKISYAASFGSDSWTLNESDTATCRRLLADFTAVSVRENSGVSLCQNVFQQPAEWVCDPTLLLPQQAYKAVLTGYQDKQYGELYYYFLDKTNDKLKIVAAITDEFNYSAYSCYPQRYHLDTQGSSLDEYTLPPVEQWLQSFASARVVITDSFHGVVFSIIFKKPFLVFINKQRGAARFNSLMALADFSERVVDNPEQAVAAMNNKDFFTPVELKSEFIDKSKEYLIEVLGNTQ